MTVTEQLIFMMLLGVIGVGVESMFNACRRFITLKPRDWAFKGHVSIWMFPVYAIGLSFGWQFIEWFVSLFTERDLFRWLSYPLWIWLIEIIIGIPTKKSLWDYSDLPFNWRGIISFGHYPAWLIFGVLVEKLRILLMSAITA